MDRFINVLIAFGFALQLITYFLVIKIIKILNADIRIGGKLDKIHIYNTTDNPTGGKGYVSDGGGSNING